MDDRSNPERDDPPDRPDSPAPRHAGPAQTGSFASFGDPDGPYVSDSPYGPGSPFPPPRDTAAEDQADEDDLDPLDDPEDFGPYRIPSGPPSGALGGPLPGGPSYRTSAQPPSEEPPPAEADTPAPARTDFWAPATDRPGTPEPGGAWDAPSPSASRWDDGEEARPAAPWNDAPAAPHAEAGRPGGDPFASSREHDRSGGRQAEPEQPWTPSADRGDDRDPGTDRTAAWDESAPPSPWDRPADTRRAEAPRADDAWGSTPPPSPWDRPADTRRPDEAWADSAPPARPWERSDDTQWADDAWAGSARDGAPPPGRTDHRSEAASAPYAWDRGEQHGPSTGYGESLSAGSGERPESAWGQAAEPGERRDHTGYGEAWSGAAPAAAERPESGPGRPSAEGDPWTAERAPYGAPSAPDGGRPAPGDGPYPGTGPAAHGAGGPPTPPEGFAAAAAGPDEPRRRSRKPLVFGIIGSFLVLALIGGGISWYLLSQPVPEDAAQSYADAWNSGDYAAMADLATGSGVEKTYRQVADNLGVEKTAVTLGETAETDSGATTPFTAKLKLSNAGVWTYKGELPLKRADGGEWKIDFTPAAIHPKLGDGQTLDRANKWGKRGAILASDGSRLDTGDATGSVKMLTGQVGKAGKKDLKELGPAYREGDPTGASGIQKSQEEQLAGTATTAIQVVPAGGGKGDAVEVGAIKGSNGKDVQTSIDPAVQEAAAGAIVNESKPTALVAIRPSSGEVLAAANVPGGYNRALEGRYPAGSTFKIISYEALLASGMGMGDAMSCPKGTKVGGWPFKNAGDAAYGKQTVTEAFATSCNTALVQKVDELLDADSFMKAATTFGVNSDLKPGLPVFDPKLPKPDSTTLLAATSLGQGQLQTTPLHMASVAAAVADGTWRSPVVVTAPEVPDQPKTAKIKGAEHLRGMMRSVVTDGTAKDVGFGAGVHGKSGTAEYGEGEDGEDPPAHAWFVGYRNDVAFAVLVEDGESGSKAAAPLAKKFLAGLG